MIERLTLNSAREVPDDLLRHLRVRWPELEVVYLGPLGLGDAAGDAWITGFRRPNEHRRLEAGKQLAKLDALCAAAKATMQYKATPTQWQRALDRLAARHRWWTLLRQGFVTVHTHVLRGEPDGRIERALLESDWAYYHEGDRRFEQVLDAASNDEDPAAMSARIREQLKGMDIYGYWRKRSHLVTQQAA